MTRPRLMLAGVIGLVGCLDGSRTTTPGPPNKAIQDAVHNAGNPFFYWLPPLLPTPSWTGQFNRFASPTVKVCALANGVCATDALGNLILVAQFSMTSSGSGGDVIRVVATDEHYVVNWQTSLSNLDPTKVYRIIVEDHVRLRATDAAPRVLELGFADVQVTTTAVMLKTLTSSEIIPLVDGRTLPIKFRIEAGSTCVEIDLECAEEIVRPAVNDTVVVTDALGARLAFGEFLQGWTAEPQLVRITRIDDRNFGPGGGPLFPRYPQYPLFFEYFTTAPEPFNFPIRIGLCNVEDPQQDAYHPDDRRTTVLAMGATQAEFRLLRSAPAADVLGYCVGARRSGSLIGGVGARIPDGGWEALAATIGAAAASLLAPDALHAAALVDGGMGGWTEDFTPAGTVDTASADLEIQSLTQSPAEPTTADVITLTAVMKNTGTSVAAPSTATIVLGGEPAPGQTFAVPALAPGGTFTIERRTVLPVAQSYVNAARADINNDVPEADEGDNERSLSFTVSPPAAIGGVNLSLPTLTIEGLTVSYTATVTNRTSGTLSQMELQTWLDQGSASRAAGGTTLLGCGLAPGDLAPGTCTVSFGLKASNGNGGTGTLLLGSATARFELKQGSTVVHTFTTPVTLVAP